MNEQNASDRINNIVDKEILKDRLNAIITFTQVFVTDNMQELQYPQELISLSEKSIFLLEEIKDRIK